MARRQWTSRSQRGQVTYLLLSIAHLLPLGTEELADFTKAGVGVLLLDSLSVILDKEHVRGKGSVVVSLSL